MDESTITLERVRGALTKQPQTARDVAIRLGYHGASSAGRVRALLMSLVAGRKARSAPRTGRRGRPAMVYTAC